MKLSRLNGLVILLFALLAARWWFPPTSEPAPALVEAVARPESPAIAAVLPASEVQSTAAHPTQVASPDAMGSASMADDGTFNNAFAVRPTPAPPPAPNPPVVAQVQTPPPTTQVQLPLPAVQAAEPTPILPPMQVIGTWDDGSQTPGVFIALPRGTVLAQVGTVLLAEFRVEAVGPQQVSLLHLETKRSFQLPVPWAPTRQ